jgi:hypothetical protein
MNEKGTRVRGNVKRFIYCNESKGSKCAKEISQEISDRKFCHLRPVPVWSCREHRQKEEVSKFPSRIYFIFTYQAAVKGRIY